jgi:ribosomal protein L4
MRASTTVTAALQKEVFDVVMSVDHIRRAVREEMRRRRTDAQRDATRAQVMLTTFDNTHGDGEDE